MVVAVSITLAVLLGGGDGGGKFYVGSGGGRSLDSADRLAGAGVERELTHANDSFTRGWRNLGPYLAATPTATVEATPAYVGLGGAADNPVAGVLGYDEARVVICAYPWSSCGWVLALVDCESGGDWYAWDHLTGNTFYGAFQIWKGHGYDLSTPAKQVEAAFSLYSTGGTGHWPSCP